MCINYQQLNQVNLKNEYMLQRIDDHFGQMQGA